MFWSCAVLGSGLRGAGYPRSGLPAGLLAVGVRGTRGLDSSRLSIQPLDCKEVQATGR